MKPDRLYGADTILPASTNCNKLVWGTMTVATSEHNITIVKWKETGIVHVASTFAGIRTYIDSPKMGQTREEIFTGW